MFQPLVHYSTQYSQCAFVLRCIYSKSIPLSIVVPTPQNPYCQKNNSSFLYSPSLIHTPLLYKSFPLHFLYFLPLLHRPGHYTQSFNKDSYMVLMSLVTYKPLQKNDYTLKNKSILIVMSCTFNIHQQFNFYKKYISKNYSR